ncbi:hypothetical protein VIGAN_01312700 [Vigna angularis var. angularis]|uniref:Uncharacterized protein n=1 Tax=Vigna angularis var. angularis TaxID=157739 RepID=A0A0S3R3K5_PHAAN|nr:hypothetical protein VIGAN_01312700 [Vigna angularis var. angularis]
MNQKTRSSSHGQHLLRTTCIRNRDQRKANSRNSPRTPNQTLRRTLSANFIYLSSPHHTVTLESTPRHNLSHFVPIASFHQRRRTSRSSLRKP